MEDKSPGLPEISTSTAVFSILFWLTPDDFPRSSYVPQLVRPSYIYIISCSINNYVEPSIFQRNIHNLLIFFHCLQWWHYGTNLKCSALRNSLIPLHFKQLWILSFALITLFILVDTFEMQTRRSIESQVVGIMNCKTISIKLLELQLCQLIFHHSHHFEIALIFCFVKLSASEE